MRIICNFNNIYKLENEDATTRIKKYIRLTDGQVNLVIGNIYNVYGILFRDNAPWYYVCTFSDDTYPSPFPAELFEVLEDELPACWRLSFQNNKGVIKSELVFPEWARDRMYYERLIDGDPQAITIFNKYRKIIDKKVVE